MKRFFLFTLVATVFAACSTDTTQDLAPEIPVAPDELQVSFDEEDTRIQLGENGRPVWTKGDLISVFYLTNANSKYQFTGKTGDANGSIALVEEGVATQQTTQIVAVYPYSEDYWFNWNTGDVEAFLPAEQTYLKDSFGIGSSIMISKTNRLYMRNVCGWFKLQFTGADTTIKKIVLRGNNDEQVAGDIYICSDDASCTLASDLTSADGVNSGDLEGTLVGTNTIITSVTLNCGKGVALNSETPTAFYIALPPQTFEKGVTITAMCDDGTMRSKSTENSLIVNRNHIVQMASLAVETLETTDTPITPTQPTPAANEIWYTSSNGKIVKPYEADVFGANITSNTYENGLGIITFDGDVTTIGDVAFFDCRALTSVTIPNSVTTIGEGAFASCFKLTSVTIPDSVTTIGDYTFQYCSALTSVTIPDSVTTIGEGAFHYCSALKSVTIPDSVTTIGDYAFRSCSKLTAFYGKFASADNRCLIMDGTLRFFAPAGLTEYTIPDSVTAIGEDAFRDCRALTSVTIPDSVTTIGDRAFYYCDALTSVTIPDSVTTIGDDAFSDCTALTSVTIPNSVTEIGCSAFEDCDALKEVYCEPTTPPSLVCDNAFDNNASDRKIYVYTESVNLYKATFGWNDYADSIYSMGNYPANGETTIILYTTSDGQLINTSTLPIKSNTYQNGIGKMVVVGTLSTIPGEAFAYCSALTSVTIPDSVTKIGDYAFRDCRALTSVTIPDSVTKIGSSAFRYCSALTSVTIPDSVTTIGVYAFRNCSALKEVYCKPTTPPSLGGSYVFDGNASDRKIYVYTESVNLYKVDSYWSEYADSIYSMGNYPANGETTIILYTTSDGQLINTSTLPIKSNTYQNGIGKMVVVGTLSTIPIDAFSDCDALTSITIPDSVTTIARSAFYDCDALTSVTIGDSVTRIGVYAFAYCSALKEVYCKPTTPPRLYESAAFDNNASGRKIYVPTASVDAYKSKQYWSEYASAIYPYTFTE